MSDMTKDVEMNVWNSLIASFHHTNIALCLVFIKESLNNAMNVRPLPKHANLSMLEHAIKWLADKHLVFLV